LGIKCYNGLIKRRTHVPPIKKGRNIMYKRTNKKVEVCNGTRTYVRTVYVNEFGSEHFKDNNKWHIIYERNSRYGGYNAPFYNGVKYIEQ
jgi:hypothetical protein